MIIQKILNNNVVITLDEKQSEIIVMGKGLAYNKRKGDEIDESKITKRFVLDSLPYHERLVDAFSSISGICVEICDDIVRYAEQRLSQKLDDSIYISLLDHISTSIERYKDGIVLKNKLLWEIKNFYKNEYDIGLFGLSVIKEKCAVSMQEDEAGFIALHIVSSEISNDIQNIYEITGFIQSILHIVKYYFKFDFDTASLNYNRFITHLKFFGHRVFSKKVNEKEQIKNNILDIIKEKYTNPYLCALKIKQFIEEKYNYYLDDDEILYLTIHIANLLTKDMNKSDNT
ncbi:PRD domain-containing protein [Clostridium sp. BJN0001]|uniref:BglG family transcription antiterminator LicT n=1 Tax=Clostridium sp. BJN0001 TaxID=2930219 RepID=UPI001FD28F60|nr:PRD domain-containing protein [Clostridium sp. BJN0001]